jgi:uncharacterized protein
MPWRQWVFPTRKLGEVHIDGRASHLDDHLLDGNQVQVLAYTESPNCLLDLSDGPIRFILDNHLGKLNTYLRMLGFDCFYDPVLDDAAIAHISTHRGGYCLAETGSY